MPRVVRFVLALALMAGASACFDLSQQGLVGDERARGGTITPQGATSGGLWTPPDLEVVDTTGDPGMPSFDALGDLPVAIDVSAPEAEGPAPVDLIEVQPETGSTAGGDLVTLRGEGFVTGMTAWFGHVAAPDVVVISDGFANVHTPPGSIGAVSVWVANPDGGTAVLEAGFTYVAKLRLDAVEPASGSYLGGTVVTLTGDGFQAPLEVFVGGRRAIDVKVVDGRTVTVRTPPGAEGSAPLVLFAGGERYATDASFVYTAPPSVLRVEPPTASYAGAARVRLVGRGLTAEALVTIGGRPARVRSVLPGRWLDVRVPEGAPGPAAVRVVTPEGETEAPDAFRYLPEADPEAPPEATGLWPDHGATVGGDDVVVFGRGLTAACSPSFGGTPATVQDFRPDEGWLRAVVPPGAPGHVPVTLACGDVALFVGTFAYEARPALVAADPSVAPAAGGASVVLTGRDLPPGDVQVWFDGQPAMATERLDAEHLRVLAPAGSPGPSRLRLVTSFGDHLAEGLFAYAAEGPRLVGAWPDLLPENGGAWVRVFGTGLDGLGAVTIGGSPCDHLRPVSSVEWRCLSPRAAVGTATLAVAGLASDPAWSAALPDALTIFEPRKKKGGTLGGPLQGTLSVTAVDGGTGLGLPGATAWLRLDDGNGRAATTDADGHATFSFDELVGPVDVSVVAPGYSASSVLGFDAKRLTVYVYTTSIDPEAGDEPPYQPPQTQYGKVTGAVVGVDKYLPVPPGSCASHATEFPVLCRACTDDPSTGLGEGAACGDGGACVALSDGSYCLTPCATDADCPATFACAGASGGVVVCQPRLGEPQTRCAVSKSSLFAYVGSPPELAEVGPQGTYQVVARPGDVAVVCTAGVMRYDGSGFLPLVMGVRRNVFVPQGMYVPDQDVLLDVPLNREVRLSLQDVPSHPSGNRPLELRSFVVLGTDGVIELDTGAPSIVGDLALLQRFPSALSGSLQGSTYAFYATARADTPQWYPYAVVLDQDIAWLTSGGVLSGSGDTWQLQPLVLDRDLVALDGDAAGALEAVGNGGLILRRTTSGWFPQYSPLTADWRATCGLSDGGRLVVGTEGAAVVRAPGQPYQVLPTGVPTELTACREVDGVTWVGGQGLIMREEGGAWHKTWLSSDERVLGFVQHGADLVAFTDRGGLFRRALDYWLPALPPWSAGEPLTAGADGWLVSARGHVFRDDGDAWRYDGTLDGVPRSVAPAGPAPCVVGDDGGVWCRGSGGWTRPAGLPEALPDLLAARVLSDGTLVAVGRQARRLGPFLPYPTRVSPPANGTLDRSLVAWDVGRRLAPSYLLATLIAPETGGFWSIVAAGDASEMRLPPGPFPGESATTLFTSAYAPGFDLNHFIYADTSSSYRRAWSQAYDTMTVAPTLVNFGVGP